ncbi:MAG: hypothetical protein L0H24_06935 [Microlunatus sp.]|nr:hypothetical protein [Microlunatus sp.]
MSGVLPSLEITDEELRRVGEVCRALDGLPLAVELAASRAAILGLGGVQEQLRPRLLGASSDMLQSVVEWSYRLLTGEQGRLLRLLTLFPGDLAALALGVATVYAGEHRESAHRWREIVAMTDIPLAYRVEGHASLALLACYHGDLGEPNLDWRRRRRRVLAPSGRSRCTPPVRSP